MKKISIFDTTISNYNLGNEIIMDEVYGNLRKIFPKDFFYKLPSMEITKYTLGYIKASDLIFFGGTNALSSRMEKYKQWGLSLNNIWGVKNVILMGNGWWQYQDGKISFYTKFLLKRSLSKKYFHSVRDSYTKDKLHEIGIDNVLNTGCPTLWDLSYDHCRDIKRNKSKNVVFTFTDYKPNPERDRIILEALKKNYSKLYFFVQGSGDYEYFQKNFSTFEDDGVQFVNPDLADFDKILETEDVDYVGTRLHAGIRALQHKKRTIIVGVDNRAVEMHNDFNIPVIKQGDISKLDSLINSDFETVIELPWENIKKWKEQFK